MTCAWTVAGNNARLFSLNNDLAGPDWARPNVLTVMHQGTGTAVWPMNSSGSQLSPTGQVDGQTHVWLVGGQGANVVVRRDGVDIIRAPLNVEQINIGVITFGDDSYPSSSWGNLLLARAVMVQAQEADLPKIEGILAWDEGSPTTLLSAAHPYRTNPPITTFSDLGTVLS